MINDYNDLNLIFDVWHKTQLEWTNKFYATRDTAYYKNHFYSLLKNSDTTLINEVYPFIRNKIPELKEKMINLYKAKLHADIYRFMNMIGEESYIKILSESFNKRLSYGYEEIIKEINHANKACGYNTSTEEFVITWMLFKQYINSNHGRFDKKNINLLEEYFRSKGIVLDHTDNQYNKYGLLTISEAFDLERDQYTPMLYHKGIESFIRFDEISSKIFNKLIEFKKIGKITDLALRPDYHSTEDKLGLSLLTEAVERGNTFSLNNFGSNSITKLYSHNYDDQLWIKIEGNNITFEEFMENFITYGNSIVTQVVHAEYKKDSEGLFITHIDHEFIFYTEDEYMARRTDYLQKGGANKRFKTFKVDNSKIPVIDALDDNFFLFVLEESFVHKDLLQEYFDTI